MKSLFLRIFLWFCGGTVVLFCAVAAGYVLDSPGALTIQWWRLGRGAIVSAARTATETYGRAGRAGTLQYFQSLSQDMGLKAALHDAQGRELTGDGLGLDPDVLAEVRSRPEGELVLMPFRGLAAIRLGEYIFVADTPRRERWTGWSRTFSISFVITSAILCYLLARHLTAPIVHLRQMTSAFASGDLAVRVTLKSLLERKDEVGGLARDFNHLASRIEGLLNAQRRLIADVSHELRSPLTRLSLAVGLMKRRGDAASSQSLSRMEREVERLNHLITQLLTLSRLESADQPPPTESIDLGALVQEIAVDADFEAAGAGKSVRLAECAASSIQGTRELIRSAIENVVRNAVKYTNEDTAVVVRLVRPSGAGVASIVVEDEGPGVPEPDLPHVFEPFYRVEHARDRQSGGAGLGLAITQNVVTLHGGSVSAENRESGGLRICISLPVS